MVIYQLIRGGDYTYDEYFGLIPPESKTFEFPLYITVPFEKVIEVVYGVYIDYLKDNDDIVKQLYQYCVKDIDIVFGSVDLENIPNIYINGCKVDSIQVDGMGINREYDIFIRLSHIWSYECNIYYDGRISISLLKR